MDVPNVTPIPAAVLEDEIRARDSQGDNHFSKEPQLMVCSRAGWPASTWQGREMSPMRIGDFPLKKGTLRIGFGCPTELLLDADD